MKDNMYFASNQNDDTNSEDDKPKKPKPIGTGNPTEEIIKPGGQRETNPKKL